MKKELYLGTVLLVSILSLNTSLSFADKDSSSDNSNVTAKIKSSGIDLDVKGNSGLEVKDVDFGKIKIGDPNSIKPQEIEDMISIVDHTGGDGWTLTARDVLFEENKNNLLLSVGVDNISGSRGQKTQLNSQDKLVAKGESQLEPDIRKGYYDANFGDKPSPGDYKTLVHWTVTTNTPSGG